MKNKIKKVYDELAEDFLHERKQDNPSKFYKEILETPTLLKLTGNVKNKKVLDLGCGPGIHAKILTKKGAKVIGIDYSKESIRLAKIESPKSLFFVGDIEKLPFESHKFDIIFSAMVIGHLKDWNKVLNEVHRVLKENGTFVFSIFNPFKEVSTKVTWKGKTFKVIDHYFKERIYYNDWIHKNKKFVISHHHKTYGTIIKLLVKHKFELIDYEDCKPPISVKNKYPYEYEKTINIPNFCVWKFKKK